MEKQAPNQTPLQTKWKSNSFDAELLRTMFREGRIRPDSKPNEIRTSVSEFQKYKTNSFRTNFNRIKQAIQDEVGGTYYEYRCSDFLFSHFRFFITRTANQQPPTQATEVPIIRKGATVPGPSRALPTAATAAPPATATATATSAVAGGAGSQSLSCRRRGCTDHTTSVIQCANRNCTHYIHETCYLSSVLQKNKLMPLFDDDCNAFIVCGKYCYDRIRYRQQVSVALQGNNDSNDHRSSWVNRDNGGMLNGRPGEEDPNSSSMKVLLDWLLTDNNYTRYKEGGGGEGAKKTLRGDVIEGNGDSNDHRSSWVNRDDGIMLNGRPAGEEDPNTTSMDVLLDWISTGDNYTRYKEQGGGEGSAIHDIGQERTTAAQKEVISKISHMEQLFRTTDDWVCSQAGRAVRQRDETEFDRMVRQKFPYYFDLYPVMKGHILATTTTTGGSSSGSAGRGGRGSSPSSSSSTSASSSSSSPLLGLENRKRRAAKLLNQHHGDSGIALYKLIEEQKKIRKLEMKREALEIQARISKEVANETVRHHKEMELMEEKKVKKYEVDTKHAELCFTEKQIQVQMYKVEQYEQLRKGMQKSKKYILKRFPQLEDVMSSDEEKE